MGLRAERLSDEIRDILATALSGGQMSDPNLDGVVITSVRMTADLQLATVYFRIYNPERQEAATKGLERCKGLLRTKLATELRIRRIPELRFFYDESIERGAHIEALLQQTKL